MIELFNIVSLLIGRIALLGGTFVALIWTFSILSDWYFCTGRWTRCTKCGERTKRES